MKLFSILLFAMFTVVGSVNAEEVPFLLTGSDGPFDFDAETGSFTDTATGFTANFTAIVAGNTGMLNATGDSFGVNATGGGDDTDQLDGVQGAESIAITFSGPVSATLTAIDVVGFGDTDAGTIDIGGVSTIVASGTDSVIPTHTELVGNTLTIAHTAGNGFGLESLTFHVKAVPEPSSLLVLGAFAGLGLCSRRRS